MQKQDAIVHWTCDPGRLSVSSRDLARWLAKFRFVLQIERMACYAMTVARALKACPAQAHSQLDSMAATPPLRQLPLVLRLVFSAGTV